MKRFKNILLYAGTEKTAAAMTRACELALENHATLTEMDVVQPEVSAVGSIGAEHKNAKLRIVSVWDVWREKPLRQQLGSTEGSARRFRHGLNQATYATTFTPSTVIVGATPLWIMVMRKNESYCIQHEAV